MAAVGDEYWFDEKTADRAVAFFETKLTFTDGEWAGQPFKLRDWQANDIIRPLFGWKRSDGTRRYRRCIVWVPRKNGKTELAAGVALLMLVGDAEDGGQVYSIAVDKDQAAIVFNKSQIMVGKSPTLSDELQCYKPSIYCPELNAAFKPLSGKPEGKHGLSMSGLIGDEIHEWKTDALYQFVHDSAAARRQPLEFMISTAGAKGGYGEQVWRECIAIRDGLIDDPETLVVIYAADDDDDWTSEETWYKANPNLGISPKLETMRAEAKRAQQLPRLVNHFKNYRLNVWTEQATQWLPINAIDDDGQSYGWDHCVGPADWKDLEKRLIGKTCFAGLDLSSTADLSSVVYWFPEQDGVDVPIVVPRFFKPEKLLTEHGKRDHLPYRKWSETGALIATPGMVIDYEFVRDQIYRDAELFNLAYSGAHKLEPHQGGVAIDRWNATETRVKLEQNGLAVVEFGQGFASMNAPSKELESLVMTNGFHHGNHPVLRQHAKAVTVEMNPAGDLKPVKNKSVQRIDGIVAMIMAIGISLPGLPEQSVYSQRGLLMVG